MEDARRQAGTALIRTKGQQARRHSLRSLSKPRKRLQTRKEAAYPAQARTTIKKQRFYEDPLSSRKKPFSARRHAVFR